MVNISSITEDEARRWARSGVLAAFALVLSYIETFIPLPIPIPGAKLGLANIPILIALKVLDIKSAFIIALIKTLVSGLLFGSPIMIPYSAGGTFLAFATMALLVKLPGLSIVLTSVVGSILHIVGQLFVATIMLDTAYVWFTFPPLLLIACFTGTLTGWMAARLTSTLQEVPISHSNSSLSSMHHSELCKGRVGSQNAYLAKSRETVFRNVDARIMIVIFTAYIVIVLCLGSLYALGICLLISIAFAIASHIGLKEAIFAAIPLATILIITTIAQVLYNDNGEIVMHIGAFPIYSGAIDSVTVMIARLICIMITSISFVKVVSFDRVSKAITQILSPLRHLGVRVDAFSLALDMSLKFIPVLVSDFEELKKQSVKQNERFAKGGLINKCKDYSSLITPLAQMSFLYADACTCDFMQDDQHQEDSFHSQGTEEVPALDISG